MARKPVRPLDVVIEATIRDKKTGKIVRKYREKGHSWTINFAEVLLKMMSGQYLGTQFAQVIDTGGNTQKIDVCDIQNHKQIVGILAIKAPSGDDSWGIVIGTGNTPEDPSDTNLANKISNGTGANKMEYSDTLISNDVTVGSSSLTFKVWRSFNNQSGDKISVAEMGIIAQYRGIEPGGTYVTVKYLIYRHVFSTPIEVDNNQVLTLTVTFSIPL